MKQRVLILCTGNSARSQMAEGIWRHEAGERFEVHSAGIRPGTVHPDAIAAMSEVGIDISGQRSKSVDEFAGGEFAYVITVCDNAREACPIFPAAARRIHWPFPDPAAVTGSAEARRNAFCAVRDAIGARIREFLASERG